MLITNFTNTCTLFQWMNSTCQSNNDPVYLRAMINVWIHYGEYFIVFIKLKLYNFKPFVNHSQVTFNNTGVKSGYMIVTPAGLEHTIFGLWGWHRYR
jgi:hypothetical protein